METDLLKRIESARAAEAKSPHPIHKVGALLCTAQATEDKEQQRFNYWPSALADTIGGDIKLGNASTTIHAEISALIETKYSTNQAQIYVTDLPCPNCAKTLAEAGIGEVYIDSTTHDTPLGVKTKSYFENVSMLMFKSAGINVYEVDLPTKSVATLHKSHARNNELMFAKAQHQSVSEVSKDFFKEQINELSNNDDTSPFAACIASDTKGNNFLLSAHAHSAMGLSASDVEKIDSIQDKYEPIIQPFNRLLGQCAYYNLKIRDGYFYASQCPTAREFVNLVGYGLTSISIGNPELCRDKWGLKALRQLKNQNVIDII